MRRRAVTIAMLAGILALAGCAAAPAPVADTPPDDAPLVAFYGDSYTLGTGASDPSKRWSTRLCDIRGWREFNPSMNGLGFAALRELTGSDVPQQIIDAGPDVVIVTLGLNDAFSFARVAGEIPDRIRDDFDRLSTELPDARIIVVEPFWYTDDRPSSLAVVSEWVQEAADRIDAEYIAGASTWIQGRDGEMADDGLHPNDAGYDVLFRRMDEALRALGL